MNEHRLLAIPDYRSLPIVPTYIHVSTTHTQHTASLVYSHADTETKMEVELPTLNNHGVYHLIHPHIVAGPARIRPSAHPPHSADHQGDLVITRGSPDDCHTIHTVHQQYAVVLEELYSGFGYAHVSAAETKLLPQDDGVGRHCVVTGCYLRSNCIYNRRNKKESKQLSLMNVDII